jgi:drug/metabolite transporter (DMT)-like permease
MTVTLLTAAAMIAFAGNSLLCRFALGQGLIDAASFTLVRVVSGGIVLGSIMLLRRPARGRFVADWRAALALFAYMVCFSFAYLSLSVGSGALILFGAVQLTMFGAALRAGEQFTLFSWSGLAVALLGLVYLVSPGLTAPDPFGAALMSLAGVAWGVYSLLGRTAADPLGATAANFLLAVPLAVAVGASFAGRAHAGAAGLALAAASGALASGLGYVVWYAALRGLTAARAATVQLSVPAIAAFGGVALLSEPVTPRLLVSSAATLGGIGIVLAQRTVARAPI